MLSTCSEIVSVCQPVVNTLGELGWAGSEVCRIAVRGGVGCGGFKGRRRGWIKCIYCTAVQLEWDWGLVISHGPSVQKTHFCQVQCWIKLDLGKHKVWNHRHDE